MNWVANEHASLKKGIKAGPTLVQIYTEVKGIRADNVEIVDKNFIQKF